MTAEIAPWTVYLLTCADNTLYCGISRDVDKRIRQHNGVLAGGARYTRSRRPVRLTGLLVCEDRGSALRLEAAVKAMKRTEKLRFFQAGDNAGF